MQLEFQAITELQELAQGPRWGTSGMSLNKHTGGACCVPTWRGSEQEESEVHIKDAGVPSLMCNARSADSLGSLSPVTKASRACLSSVM